MSRNEPSAHQSTKHSAGISDNPKGIAPSSPEVASLRATLGSRANCLSTQRGCGHVRASMDTTPLGLRWGWLTQDDPRVARSSQPLGFVAESFGIREITD